MRWSVIGTGKRATLAVGAIGEANVIAVGSSVLSRAKAFAEHHNKIPHFGLRDEMAAHVNADAVYVACSNRDHASAVLTALSADKHVVCEAPLAVNAAEAELLLRFAAERSLFLMEVYTLPFCSILQSVLAEARQLGTLFRINVLTSQPKSGPLLLCHAGGAWMTSSTAFLGLVAELIPYQPTQIEVTTAPSYPRQTEYPARSDTDTTVMLRFGLDVRADLHCRVGSQDSDDVLELLLTKGRVVVNGAQPMQFPISHTLYMASLDTLPERLLCKVDTPISVMQSLFTHVEGCISQGFIESPQWPHKKTLRCAQLSDVVRTKLGLAFPCEVDE